MESPVKFPGTIWTVDNHWKFHVENYLKTPRDSKERYAALHAEMRRHGIDWFREVKTTNLHQNRRQSKSAAHRAAISKSLRERPHHFRGRRLPELWYWRNKTERPRVHEWAVTVNGQFLVVKNLKAWADKAHIPYQTLKGKIRFHSWPYIPRAGINIEHIRKWS